MSGPADEAVTRQDSLPDTDAIGGAALQAGMQVGNYALLRRIGAGGMGEVWLARQHTPIERVVALKLVRPETRDPLREALFQIERQALARLEHRSIARVYEAGTTAGGAQFFAMEWVDGERLDQFCRSRNLSLAQIQALLVQACRGMQHAHLKSILHRDLKPANLLVRHEPGEEPQLKIIDFGIATTAGAGQWRPAGTEGYMSPEQMAPGEILDARCDVYALGVVLLELAMHALQIPFSEWWWLDSTARFEDVSATGRHARQAREQSLPRLPYELRAVVIRAIHPDREQRYASAEALATDLQALIDDRPVQALPARRGYLLAKFVTRHRWGVWLSGLGLLALVALASVAMAGWRRAEAANRDAGLTAGFLRSILAEVDPERALGLDTTLLRQVLEAATVRSSLELADAPHVRADIEATIAGTLRALGEYQRAAAIAGESRRDVAARLGEDSPEAQALDLQVARARQAAGEGKVARALAEARWPRALQLLGPESVEACSWAALLVRMRREQGEIAAAIALGESALAQAVGASGSGAVAHDAWIELLMETGIAQAADGRFDAALASLQRAVDAQERLRGAGSFPAVKARGERAVTLFMAKRYAEAREEFSAILPEHMRILGAEHPTTLTIRGNIAAALTLSGDPAAAAEALEDLLALRVRVNGAEHPETLSVRGNLAAARWRAGQFAQAEVAFRSYLDQCRRMHGPAHPSCAERLAGLGKALREQGKYEEAATALTEAYARKQVAEGKQFASAPQVAAELAELYRRRGMAQEQQRWQTRAGELQPAPVAQPARGPDPPR